MYLSKEELKIARERQEAALLNAKTENEEPKTLEERYKESEKRLDEAIEGFETAEQRYKKIEKIARERIEKDFPDHPDKEIFIWIATAILM